LTGSYQLSAARFEQLELFMSIDNVTDRDPKFSSGGVGGAYPVLYPALGRTYRFGVRLQL
jgi:outer membrane receptor protein involved in Fe transport